MIFQDAPQSLRRSTLALLTLAVFAGCATGRPASRGNEIIFKPEEAEAMRGFLYFDMDLEAVVHHIPAKGDLARAIHHLRKGKVAEARKALTPAAFANAGPHARMTDALIKQKSGDGEGAQDVLRGLLDDETAPVTFRLWAAHALRAMGVPITGPRANFAFGVVAEVVVAQRTNVLGVYADGTVWFVNEGGLLLVYGPKDGLSSEVLALGPTLPAAMAGAQSVTDQDRPPLGAKELRLTYLTPSGAYRTSEDLRTFGTTATPTYEVYLRLQDILDRIAELRTGERRLASR